MTEATAKVFRVGDNHLFSEVPDGWEFDVNLDQVFGVAIRPKIAVIHYGVTRTHDELQRALLSNDYVSAHLAVSGTERRITQMVRFNQRAGHAGKTARWGGMPNVNGFSIGIEINNPGPVLRGDDGVFRDVHGRRWDGEVYSGRHFRPGFPWSHWAVYSEEDLAIVAAIVLALKEHYGLTAVVGHDEIRLDKADPGPAFPMGWLRSVVFPGS
jgi:N-acetyl-anhydromuramyl-L-alanine amidase AmpD